MILDLYLLRHAESKANLDNIVGGRIINTPLSDRGKRQAQALGKRLKNDGIKFDKVYVSPARRIIETPLSDRGREQAKSLGERLYKEEIIFDEVYTSSAVRTIETSRIVLSKILRSPNNYERVDDLLELSQGELEGQSRDLIYTPQRRAMMSDNPFDYKSPGG